MAIDSVEGMVLCDCDDFTRRCLRHAPHYDSHPDRICKHLIRAILNDCAHGRLQLPPDKIRLLRIARNRTRIKPVAKVVEEDEIAALPVWEGIDLNDPPPDPALRQRWSNPMMR